MLIDSYYLIILEENIVYIVLFYSSVFFSCDCRRFEYLETFFIKRELEMQVSRTSVLKEV
jgi:hypothetical protein